MDCKTNQRMIPAFLNGKLTTKEAKKFLLHTKGRRECGRICCKECMEELTIQYLVMIGAAILEEGKSFDLHKELDRLIAETERRIRRHEMLTICSYLCEIAAVLAVILVMIMVVF